ncbi:MAG TPA: hypothetical protein DHV60_07075 [Verrucomicrobiales bacterium]|nr:hypothetical protein [Verrucomicrobiales bacterium]
MRTSARILYFPVKEKGGKTFVCLSPLLKAALTTDGIKGTRHLAIHQRDDEQKLIRQIPSVIFKHIEAQPAESPEQLIEKFLAAKNFKYAVALLPSKELLKPTEKEQFPLLENLAFLCQGLNSVKSLPKPSITIAREGLLAAAPLEYRVPNKPGTFQTWQLWMIKGDKGWHLIPKKSIETIVDEKIKQKIKGLSDKLDTITKNQRKERSKKMLSHVTNINLVELKEAVIKQKAINLFKLYRSRLRSYDYASALDCCAMLDSSNNTRTLKNFDYAIRGASDSVATAAKQHAMGILMTGMGRDGAKGLLQIKDAGGKTVAQDETTSVVFGMPKAAIDLGASDKVVKLQDIAAEILHP